MQASNKNFPQTFHMSLVEPLMIFVVSALGVALAVGLFWSGIGDLIKTILLFILSVSGLLAASSMIRKLEFAGSELVISHLITKRIIAREDIDAYFLDEQGFNRRTRSFVTIHLADGRRIRFKAVREGNDALMGALEGFTGFKPAVELPEKSLND